MSDFEPHVQRDVQAILDGFAREKLANQLAERDHDPTGTAPRPDGHLAAGGTDNRTTLGDRVSVLN
jgi:hypothetical protein